MPASPLRSHHVLALGSAQTLAWASTYYLAAILAPPMARDLGLPATWAYGGLTLALGISALLGPAAGRAIDRWGGRPVLMGTNGVFAAGLAVLALAQDSLGWALGWALLGLGMGAGLYEAAFASLVRLHGHGARNAITGITLIAGFASTVGWPLSAWMETQWGWRGACWGWAGLHLLLGLPLNAYLPRIPTTRPGPVARADTDAPPQEPAWPERRSRRLALGLLSTVFAITWFISTAMAAHLPQLLMGTGMGLAAAVAVGALVGPAQVAGRLLEFGLLRHVHPLLSARLAALAHPVGAALLLLGGPALATPFAVLHGAGNGILTIAKGTLPLVMFGPHGYGARQGWLMVPARLAQAMAPLAFGACLAWWRSGALWLTTGLGLVALLALLQLRPRMAHSAHPGKPTP